MSMNDKCPIWGTPATVDVETGKENLIYHVNSARTGGKYTSYGLSIPQSSTTGISELDTEAKIKLTSWIVDQNRFNIPPTVNLDIIEQAKSWPRLSVSERADRLLRYLEKKTKRLGDVSSFYFPEEDKNKDPQFIYELLAWTGSEKLSEVVTLVEYCNEQKWLNHHISKDERPGMPMVGAAKERYGIGKYEIMLRPPGYARLAELDGANSESTQGFVAMWFDDSMNEASKAIQNAISDAGYKPQQINQKEHINKICDEIIAEIRRSRFVVADFTSEPDNPRGGVYYEAGFAQGQNIPVIWTCREELIGQVHFDTNHYNHITWENEADLYKKLKKRIEAVIGDGPNRK